MIAEVISIGDELTSGQRLDTNSQWLSERLGELGIRVMYHTTVADDLAANVRVFRQAVERADVIVASGGLGPTADDLTREAIAQAAGVDLVLDEPSLQHIQRLFAHRKREMPPANRVQAMFPRESRVIPNPHGTAPGIDRSMPRAGQSPARIFALPGVPAEMREMWHGTVAVALAEMAGPDRKVIRHRCIKCFGVGESDLEQMLPDLIRRGREPQVGITVSKATITLRITAQGADEAACLSAMEPTIATIRQCLGSLIYGEENDELHHVVLRELDNRRQTLATAEWSTRGTLAHWLGETPSTTNAFRGGLLLSHASAFGALGPGAESLAAVANSSREFVEKLAALTRQQFGTDYALVIGPAPNNATPGQTVGEVQVALASAGGIVAQAFPYAGHPDILVPRTGKQALNLLRLALAGK